MIVDELVDARWQSPPPQNVKADYAKAFWNVVNWADVQDRSAAATSKAQRLIF